MAKPTNTSPRIKTVGWGHMEIETLGSGKDFKLWPGGGRSWDWQETGTEHSPGIQVADVEELVSHSPEVVVLTRGVFSRLKVPEETVTFLEKQNIETIVTDTKRGVQIYNDHVERDIPVGGLFHSTC